jgi:hypothetical protein
MKCFSMLENFYATRQQVFITWQHFVNRFEQIDHFAPRQSNTQLRESPPKIHFTERIVPPRIQAMN